MRVKLRNRKREHLFTVRVDPRKPPPVVRPPAPQAGPGHEPVASDSEGGSASGADEGGQEVYLNWDQAVDGQGYLRRCPACGCRELFARKDFNQTTGLFVVVLAAVAAVVLYAIEGLFYSLAVLGSVVVIDALVFLFTGRCMVCYACRSEFHDLPIRKDQPGWDLAVGEKYRDMPGEVPASSANEERRE